MSLAKLLAQATGRVYPPAVCQPKA